MPSCWARSQISCFDERDFEAECQASKENQDLGRTPKQPRISEVVGRGGVERRLRGGRGARGDSTVSLRGAQVPLRRQKRTDEERWILTSPVVTRCVLVARAGGERRREKERRRGEDEEKRGEERRGEERKRGMEKRRREQRKRGERRGREKRRVKRRRGLGEER
ncbi:unnamed protein product [Pleuronectes platessa]|uniref:Uncharacterized protein n=1 Tax=Pleuronectes platessa TaxID=8262 RepID=A0A9N7YMI4_PLEPL|nr:unnamed protein product [Pleuronectes platessa]